MRTSIKEKEALLLLSDGVAMFASFLIALLLGHRADYNILDLLYRYGWGFADLFLSTIILFFILDLYTLNKVPQRFTTKALTIGSGLLASSVLSAFIFFFFKEPVPRAVFIIFYGIAFALILFFRYLISKRMYSQSQWRVLLVGEGKRSSEVAQVISSRPYLSNALVGFVSRGNGRQAPGNLTRLGSTQDLVSIAMEIDIDQVIVAENTVDDELLGLLLECMQRKIKVTGFREVIEQISGKVPIDHLNDNWFILTLSASEKRYFWYLKRTSDILLSCIGLCLGLPLLPLAALLIKLDSRGPVFYSQWRMGRGSVPFRAWKLRTMTEGADRNNVHWTMDNDSRITRVGKIVRKTRLDEVPQLINILKGEMSLIGPRPEALSLVEMYTREIPYYPERHLANPGITGWAQINYPYGNSIEDTRQKLMYDFYYIKNRSVTLDLMIFLRTIRIVLTGKGAM